MAQPTQAQWAATLLRRLGIHQTPGAVQALTGWANAEGGHWHNDARFNPLNTTQPEPGAGNTGTQGNIKVYKNWDQGLQATVETLRNGRYDGILKALQSGNPNAVANAIGQTPWGTSGGLVQKTIASTPRVAGVHAFGAGGSGTASSASPASASAGGGAARTTTTSTPGVDNSSQRRAAIAAFLGDNRADPLSFAMQVRSLRDVPGQKVTTTTQTPSNGGGSSASTPSGSRSRSGTVRVAAGAERPGIGLQKPVLSFLHQLAGVSGREVDVTTGTNHNRMTTSGNVSDHWGGNAADLGVGGDARQNAAVGKKGDLIAAHAIQVASGKSFGEALQMARKGGVWNFETKRGRVQILWRTLTGGNHFNHVHVGVNPNR